MVIQCDYAHELLIEQFMPTLADEAEAKAVELNKKCGCPELIRYVVRRDEDGWHMVWREPVEA